MTTTQTPRVSGRGRVHRTRTRARAARRAVRGALLAVVGLTLLGACTSTSTSDDSSGSPVDVVDQGYQSGDGSSRLWATSDRSDPVDLDGTDFAGGTQDVSAWRGDVVVLNTWYAACPPCRAEAADLAALAEDYAAQGVHVLGINGTDDAGTAEAFQRTFAIPYPSIADTGGHAIAALQGAVPIQAVPTTVVLDRQGRVAARVLGLADGSTLRGLVDTVLAEQAEGAGPAATGATTTSPDATP